jgi:hypothetical protein
LKSSWFYSFTVDFTILLLKSTISNGKINSETVKSTNVRSKINLCSKSLFLRKKNFSVDDCYCQMTLGIQEDCWFFTKCLLDFNTWLLDSAIWLLDSASFLLSFTRWLLYSTEWLLDSKNWLLVCTRWHLHKKTDRQINLLLLSTHKWNRINTIQVERTLNSDLRELHY